MPVAEAALSSEEDEEDRSIEILRLQIAHQADTDAEYGWKCVESYDEKAGRNVSLRIPHRALICASLRRAHAWHLMPTYDCRSPSGLKLPNDDRAHTDAWIGAGFAPDSAYDDDMPEQRLFMETMYEVQRQWLSFQIDVLARGSQTYVSGTVIHDPLEAGPDKILVVASAAPEYAPAAIQCAGVIAETGSKLAHMTIVSREEGVPVVRVADAVNKFKPGSHISIDFSDGTVELFGI
jgi:phosphohistidine swiveling domain-containing protein